MLVIQKITVVVLLAVLIFNLTQRKHLSYGEGKRYASLYAAGFILLFYAATIVFKHFFVSPAYLLGVLALEAVGVYSFRDKIFLFHARCAACGKKLALRRILYVDAPFCEECEAEIEDAARSSLGNPGQLGEMPRRVEEVDWEHWTPVETAVLCFLRDRDRLMLIDKKTGLGAGKVNAPGGRVEAGETPHDAAVREVREEINLEVRGLSQRGELSFIFADGYSLKCYVFFCEQFTGSPAETVEARPFWSTIEDVPYDRMWADDRFWLPRMLHGDYVIGRFIFDGDDMLSQEVIVS